MASCLRAYSLLTLAPCSSVIAHMMLYDLSFIQSSAIAGVQIIDLLFLPVFEPYCAACLRYLVFASLCYLSSMSVMTQIATRRNAVRS